MEILIPIKLKIYTQCITPARISDRKCFFGLNSYICGMKNMLVVAKLNEGSFEKFMGFMKSEEGINERRKVADLTKTIGTVSPDKNVVMFKISVHNENALNSFLDGSNPVSKPIWDEVLESYEIFEINKVS